MLKLKCERCNEKCDVLTENRCQDCYEYLEYIRSVAKDEVESGDFDYSMNY